MADLITLQFDGRTIRTVTTHEGEILFVGKDVCEQLGYVNPADAMTKHCKGVAIRYPLQTPGGMQDVRVLRESDVLRLIVASKLPAAQRFETWVFEDVIPTIRRTGSYGAPARLEPTTMSRLQLLQLAMAAEEERLQLESKMATLAPKADALDRIATATEGAQCVRDSAKHLQIREIDLRRLLAERQWIYRRPGCKDWLGYADKLQQGLIEHKVSSGPKEDGSEWISTTLRITPKGLAKLAELLELQLTAVA